MSSAALRREITAALRTMDPAAGSPLDELVAVLYDELKDMARRQLAREAAGHTLQPTALLHEAYLKLAASDRIAAAGRGGTVR